MRELLTAAALLALAGCTLSVPASPELRSDLPSCQKDQVVVSQGSGFACAPQSALTLAEIPYASTVDTADAVGVAPEADRAGHADRVSGVTSDAQLVLGPVATGKVAGPGVWVTGGAVVGRAPVPFVVGSFDSTNAAPVLVTTLGGSGSIFGSLLSVTLPQRPAATNLAPVRAQDQYQVLVRASGAVRGSGDISNGRVTRCRIDLTVTYSSSTGSTVFQTTSVPVAILGDQDSSTPGEYPWTASTVVSAYGGNNLTVAAKLVLDASDMASPKCSTGNDDGELTHVEIEAF